jgi:hypothetical protein
VIIHYISGASARVSFGALLNSNQRMHCLKPRPLMYHLIATTTISDLSSFIILVVYNLCLISVFAKKRYAKLS